MKSGPPAYGDVLVVIPCLNEESYIGGVIAAVLRDPAAERVAIVVADGGSTDATVAVVRQLAAGTGHLRLIANARKIQSTGVNLAARQFGAGRRWLVRMDAHADYPEAFVSKLVAEAERTGAASVVVAMKARGLNCFQNAAAVAQNSLLGAGGSPHRCAGAEGFVDHGHHALFDLQRFLALGGYDEAQSHNEDAEFDVRLARSGGRIWLSRAADVVYFPRARPRDLYLQYRNYGRGRARTILRHRLRPKVRQLIPAAVAPCVLAAFAAPWLPLAAVPVLLWLLACVLCGVYLGMREKSRCALASGCAAPIIHLGWSIGFWLECLATAATALPRPASGLRTSTR
ncbi:MAG: glycosyltransferase family 2 protein [Rhizomicrobium sp.]